VKGLRRFLSRVWYGPTLLDMWRPPADAGRIVSVVQWRDLVVIACEYGVYVVSHGQTHFDLIDVQFQKIRP
jgi:hypothetical protein